MASTRYRDLRDQILRQRFPNAFASAVLRDADSNYVPLPISERLVQCIWYDQRILTGTLKTMDGTPVQVISPGWWNLEAGPDFRHATIKVGNGPERQGDIEIHLRADDWVHHGHERDPFYDNVILHVVLWEAGSQRKPRTRLGEIIPQVVLQNQLDATLEQLLDEIDMDSYPHNAGNHAGRCAPTLKLLPELSIGVLLNSAGDERFSTKVRKFLRWIHRSGPEQAFYEGWMEALGYKANKVAFRTLAQRAPLTLLSAHPKQMPAILFGIANLLPTIAAKSRDTHVRSLWNNWWKLRPDFEDKILPLDTWRMYGIRPVNHPHRRLGTAIALLKKHPNFAEKIIAAIESDGDPAKLFLQIKDDYWMHHYSLGGKTQSKATELLGASRVQEILSNIVYPFAAAYAENRNDVRLFSKAKEKYDSLPPSGDNAILRLAGQQLFDKAIEASRHIQSNRQQQGLIQIFQDFCLNDKSGCQQCQFPELVQRWTKEA